MPAGRSGHRPCPLIPTSSRETLARQAALGGTPSCARICYNAPVDVYGIIRPSLREKPSADGDGGRANGALELNS